jgi:hypothetical protein
MQPYVQALHVICLLIKVFSQITSRVMLSKPAAVAALVQRSSRVPPTPAPTNLQSSVSVQCYRKIYFSNCSQRFGDDDDIENVDAEHGQTPHCHSWNGHHIRSPSQNQVDPCSPSRSCSCSQSPGVRSKQGRSPMADLEVEINQSAAKAQKINNDGDRPKAAQYESSVCEVILEAASIYCILIFTEDAFPAVLISAPPHSCQTPQTPVESGGMGPESSGLRWTPPDSAGIHQTPADSGGVQWIETGKYIFHTMILVILKNSVKSSGFLRTT